MAITRLADVIQPEVFTPYVTQQTMERSVFYQSGIITNDAEMDARASGPNTLVNMPYFEDLAGESQNMTDDGYIDPLKIATNADVARKIARTSAWGANGLSGLLSGTQPMQAIGDRVADWWTRDMQRVLLSELQGVFASPSMAEKVLDITGKAGDAALWSASAFVDAVQLMGDAKDLITAVAMHSVVEAYLAKQELIQYETSAEKGTRIPYYMGKRVIVDDSMPYDTGAKIARAYLFGAGAIALGNGTDPNIIQTETDRDKMASSGEDYLINRNNCLHRRRWDGDIWPTIKENPRKI